MINHILKYILISLGILLIVFIVVGVYFASSTSSTYPPLKVYYTECSNSEFEKNLENLELTNSFNLTITDTTGNYPQDYSVYFTINYNDQKEYILKYEKVKSFLNNERIKISLIGAFDQIKNSGGYKKSNKDIDSLIELFETDIYEKLKNN